MPARNSQKIAQAYISQLDAAKAFNWQNPVTEVTPLKGFWIKAEDYHQDYANKNPGNPYMGDL